MRSNVAAKVRERVELFFSRSAPEEATLTLDGTGPNGAIQNVVLDCVGADRLARLKAINVLSGSFYSLVGYLASREGLHKWSRDQVDGLDRAFRRAHHPSVWRCLSYVASRRWRRAPLYDPGTLLRAFQEIVDERFLKREVKQLPGHPIFWLHDLDAKALIKVDKESPFADVTLSELADCVAAVPQVYGAGTLRGARVIDPVYSGSYHRLLAQLRQSSTNHLISNIMKDRVDEKEILLKPHGFGDGRRMIVGDFVRLSLNLPNPRIKSAYLEGL